MTNGEHTHHKEERATAKDRLLQTIAILGLIAVLLLGAWGIIQLAFNLPGIFSGVGSSITGVFNRTATSTPAQTVLVTVPQSIVSDQPFTLTWRHAEPSTQYAYTVSYSCVDGVSIKAPLPNGKTQAVDCNTPFNYLNAKEKMTLTPSVVGAGGKVTFTVSAVRLSNNRVAVAGTASTNAEAKVAEAKAVATTKTTTTKKTTSTYYANTAPKTTMYGYPDLAVSINSVNSLISVYGRTAVVFTIQNVSTNVAYAGWTFDAHLPINGGYVYHSQAQQPLYPGDRIVYTLTFDQDERDYRRGSAGMIAITVDPQNQVYEFNESNNTASAY